MLEYYEFGIPLFTHIHMQSPAVSFFFDSIQTMTNLSFISVNTLFFENWENAAYSSECHTGQISACYTPPTAVSCVSKKPIEKFYVSCAFYLFLK